MRVVSAASTTDGPPAASPRVDRPILVSNLIAGALCQLVLVALGFWPLAVIGAGYVAVGSVVLAAAYARDTLTPRQEIGAWVGTWLLAVALWAWIGYEPGFGSVLGALVLGLSFGTVCVLVWQVVALAVRQVHVATWSSRGHV
jgi:hypothetical protein